MIHRVQARTPLTPNARHEATAMHTPRARAFTLIELLVVIAIIALLIGILLPSLGAAREAGKKVKCASQMRQIMTAWTAYTLDHNEYHHGSRQNYSSRMEVRGGRGGSRGRVLLSYYEDYSPDFDGGLGAYWGGLYDSYLGVEVQDSMFTPPGIGENTFLSGWDVWSCPSAQLIDAYLVSGRSVGEVDNPDFRFATMSFNGVFRGTRGDSEGALWKRGNYNTARPKRITEVQQPSKLIVFQDGYEQMLDGNGDTLNDLYQHGDVKDREYVRHGGSCNTCWLDGSVRGIQTDEMDGSRPWYTDVWDPDLPGGPE
jgi:prepilin-type N-terminal cleavage/methylation domain-containing protein/prepilin-type processing-associated H-X9-DG protein